MNEFEEIWRPQETSNIVGLCDQQIRNLEERGEFPKRFPLSEDGRAKGHLKSEVLEWMRERAATRDDADDVTAAAKDDDAAQTEAGRKVETGDEEAADTPEAA